MSIEIQVAGLHQYTIAQRIGVSEGQLSKILSGRRPLDDVLAKKIRDAIRDGATA